MLKQPARRLLSWILTLCMLLALVSLPAAGAANVSGTAKQKTVTYGVAEEGHRVIYKGNAQQGGSVSHVPEDLNSYAEGQVTLSTDKPFHSAVERNVVVFAGWTETATSKIYGKGDTAPDIVTEVIMGNVDVTVYAAWGYDENSDGVADVNENTYSLIYDCNGGNSAPTDAKKYLIGQTALLGGIAAHDQQDGKNVLFLGWSLTNTEQRVYTKDDGALLPKNVTSVTFDQSDVTVYAVWGLDANGNSTPDVSETCYTLTYNVNGGQNGPVDNERYLTGTKVMLDTTKPTRGQSIYDGEVVDVVCCGWTGDSVVQGRLYAAGDPLPSLPKDVTFDSKDIILYAVWSFDYNGDGQGDVLENSVVVDYRPNGGAGESHTVRYPEGSTITIKTNTMFSKTNAVFSRWNTEGDGHGISYNPLTKVTLDTGLTLYAQWENLPLSVTVAPGSVYNGKLQTPDITVTDSTGHELTPDDYVAVYSENLNAGTAKVTVVGKNSYAGLSGVEPFSIAKGTQVLTFTKGTEGLAATYGESFINTASSDLGGVITYRSSDPDTAAVDANGEVTIFKGGKVTITATAAGTENFDTASESYELNIAKADPALSFASSAMSVKTTDTVSNTLFTVPVGLTGVTYESSDSGVVTVDSATGKATLTGTAGKATITAVFPGNDQYNRATASYIVEVSNDEIFYTASGYTGVYDGLEHSIRVAADDATVTYSTDDTDYVPEAPTYTDAGSWTVYYRIERAGYDMKTGSAQVKIAPAALTRAVLAAGTYTYTGSEIKPDVIEVKAGDLTVAEGQYSVTYYSNVNAGTALAVIAPDCGNYAGNASVPFTIGQKALTDNDLSFEPIPDQTYTGSPITPGLVVKDGDKVLVEGKDYTLRYKDNIDVGTAKVTVEAVPGGNYSGQTEEKTFQIVPGLGAFTVIVGNEVPVYDGSVKTAQVVVLTDGRVLTEGKDYTLSGDKQTDAGTYAITVTGINNYQTYKDGEGSFTIAKADKMASFQEAEVSRTYGDEAFTNPLTLSPDDGAAITYATGNPNVATVDENGLVTIVGAGEAVISGSAAGTANYNPATAGFVLQVGRKALGKPEAIPDQIYTGSEIKPGVTIKDGEKTLVEGQDYQVTYDANTNPGTATVTIEGINDYVGTQPATFEIIAGTSALRVELSDEEHIYNGGEHSVAVITVRYGAVILDEGQYTVEYSDRVDAGEATVTIKGKGGSVYGGLETSAHFIIQPKDISTAHVEDVPNQTYSGQELKPALDVKDPDIADTALVLDKDYTASYDQNVPVGTAKFTITGKDNYIGTQDGNFVIDPKVMTFQVSLDKNSAYYDGKSHTPILTVKDGNTPLTGGVDFNAEYVFASDSAKAFDGAQFIEIGTYKIAVTGLNNYVGSTGSATFTISRESTGGGGDPGGGPVEYTITASAGAGGSISPNGKVDVVRSANQTFIITPDEGYKVEDVLVDDKSVGAVGVYIFEKVTKAHSISVSFTEADDGHQVADPDDTGVSGWLNTRDHNSFLQGYPGDLFGPTDNMTRAEVAQMFYSLLLNQDVPITTEFIDIDPNAWYAKAVDTLASLGIVKGVGDGAFAPERPVTRAEFVVIAMRFAKEDVSEETPFADGGSDSSESPFADVDPNEWYYDCILGSSKYGWVTGYEDGTFRPMNTITRVEVTVLVNRMLGRSPDKSYIDSHASSLKQFGDVGSDYWAYYEIAEATNTHDYAKSAGKETWK